MNRVHFAVFAALALLAGLTLPFIVNNLLGYKTGAEPKLTTTTIPIAHTGSGENGLSKMNISIISDELIRFTSYSDLYSFIQYVTTVNKSTSQLLEVFKETAPRGVTEPVLGVLTPVAPSQETTTAPLDFSATNVQVEGIDEIDSVKTDGNVIAVSLGNKVYLVNPKTRSVDSVLVFNETIEGLYLYSSKLIVLGEGYYQEALLPEVDCRCFIIPPGYARHVVYVFNISTPSQPKLVSRIDTTGLFVNSRLRDKFAYFIFNTPLDNGVVPLVNERPVPLETMIAVSDTPSVYTIILVLDLDDLTYTTYTFLTGGGTWLYMSHRYLYIAREIKPVISEYYLLFINETMPYLPIDIKEKILNSLDKGDLLEAWMTLEDYLYSTEPVTRDNILEKARLSVEGEIKYDKSVFYVFSLNGSVVEYKGSFTVDGELLDQFAMEEYGDYFVVATTVNNYGFLIYTTRPSPVITNTNTDVFIINVEIRNAQERRVLTITPEDTRSTSSILNRPKIYLYPLRTGESSNNVYIIDLANLEIAGRLTGLAPGERIYAARLIDHVFYLVTFRQVDPLFAIDISDPRDPRVLGFLKIPGFSEYLHPLPGDKLLGVGIEEWDTLKISLFDVRDPVNISEIAVLKIQPGWSIALRDHHAVTIHYAKGLVVIPYSKWSGENPLGILAISYSDGRLQLLRLITHLGATRTIYIGKELFSISHSTIKIIDLDTLSVVTEIALT